MNKEELGDVIRVDAIGSDPALRDGRPSIENHPTGYFLSRTTAAEGQRTTVLIHPNVDRVGWVPPEPTQLGGDEAREIRRLARNVAATSWQLILSWDEVLKKGRRFTASVELMEAEGWVKPPVRVVLSPKVVVKLFGRKEDSERPRAESGKLTCWSSEAAPEPGNWRSTPKEVPSLDAEDMAQVRLFVLYSAIIAAHVMMMEGEEREK